MAQSITRVTNLGAQKTGEQLVLGRCYMIKYYSIGSGGHDTTTGLPLVPDQTLVELPSIITSPTILPIPVGSAYIVGPRVVEYRIQLPSAITGSLSSIGLYGEIVSVVDTVNDSALIGSRFLHSIGNFALQNKASGEIKTLTLRLNNV